MLSYWNPLNIIPSFFSYQVIINSARVIASQLHFPTFLSSCISATAFLLSFHLYYNERTKIGTYLFAQDNHVERHFFNHLNVPDFLSPLYLKTLT